MKKLTITQRKFFKWGLTILMIGLVLGLIGALARDFGWFPGKAIALIDNMAFFSLGYGLSGLVISYLAPDWNKKVAQ